MELPSVGQELVIEQQQLYNRSFLTQEKDLWKESLENSLPAGISLFISWANSYLLNQLLKYLGETMG